MPLNNKPIKSKYTINPMPNYEIQYESNERLFKEMVYCI